MCSFSSCLKHEASRDNPTMNVQGKLSVGMARRCAGREGQQDSQASNSSSRGNSRSSRRSSCLLFGGSALFKLGSGQQLIACDALVLSFLLRVYTASLSLPPSLTLPLSLCLSLSLFTSPFLYSAFSASAKCQVQFNNKANNTRITARLASVRQCCRELFCGLGRPVNALE